MITKELVDQWAQEWYDTSKDASPSSEIDYIAQCAATHGAAQRDAELMGVGMEPRYFPRFFADATVEHVPYHTPEQLAAARLQEREHWRKFILDTFGLETE